MKVLVAQSCLTLCDPTDCSPPGSSVPGILQARILEWVAFPFSKGSSQPRDRTWVSRVSCIGRQVLYSLSHQGSPSSWLSHDQLSISAVSLWWGYLPLLVIDGDIPQMILYSKYLLLCILNIVIFNKNHLPLYNYIFFHIRKPPPNNLPMAGINQYLLSISRVFPQQCHALSMQSITCHWCVHSNSIFLHMPSCIFTPTSTFWT